MKHLKRFISLFVSLLIIICVCGCKDENSKVGNQSFSMDDFDMDFGEKTGDNSSAQETPDNGSSVSSGKSETGKSKIKKKSSSSADGKDDTSMEEGTLEEYTGSFTPMSIPSRKNAYKLTNTYNKIKKGESVKVVFYGGSVTSGTGASDENKTSFSALTAAYLKSLSSKVSDYKLSIGGTGTYLAAARFEHDVVSKNPDLLFIEYAINDGYSGINADLSKANLEYMIRTLNAKNPNADIVLLLITNKSVYGTQYTIYKAHKAVADYYNIPIVDLGGEMYNRTKESYDGFSDSVHPNDKGHKIYSEILIDALKELFVDGSSSAHKMPASRLCKDGYSSLTNTVASKIQADKKWSLYSWFNNTSYEKTGSPLRSSQILKDLYPKYLAPDDVGRTLTFSFTGTYFGMIGSLKDGAIMKFEIDGDTVKRISGTSNVALVEYPVFTNLKNGSHTVKITVSGSQYIAIAGFVVCK